MTGNVATNRNALRQPSPHHLRQHLRHHLRHQIRAERRALSSSLQARASQRIICHLQNHLPYQRANRVGFYWPNDGEVDLLDLVRAPSKRFFLPVLQEYVRPWLGRGLLFGDIDQDIRPNHYGIPEPKGRSGLLRASELDYVLIPLVAFDRAGHRLGMGGGYYDRALSKLRKWKPVLLIGVAHDLQEVQALEHKPWDIKLDGVVTESELMMFR